MVDKLFFEEAKQPLRDASLENLPKSNDDEELLIGFANSLFQTYGDCGESNWTAAAKNGTVPCKNYAIERWDRFEYDLDRMKELGVNSYRFSIEWSHIEPAKGFYDLNVLEHYAKIFESCHKRNIEPMLTLYHYNEPLWFSNMGSFEKEENIECFVNFCKKVFSLYNKQVKLWVTFNEPSLHAFAGYFCGQFPPHRYHLGKTLSFLKNLLKAHVKIYKILKDLPGGEKTQIGIVHNPLRFIPRYWWEPMGRIVSAICTKLTNNLVLSFLKNGYYTFFPGHHFHDPLASSSYDFIGLNFYGEVVVGFNKKNIFGVTCFPHQEMSDGYFPIDLEAFGMAIDSIASLKKPIYITEIGIATESDLLRKKFFSSYFDTIKKKLAAGVDIRSCYIWTFADNYEWHLGYSKKFGLHDQHRIARESTDEFKKFIKHGAKVKKVA